MAKPLFEEKQRFMRWWLTPVVVGAGILAIWTLLSVPVRVLPVPTARSLDWPTSPLEALAAAGGCLSALVLVAFGALRVTVKHQSVDLRFSPFIRRHIPIRTIARVEATTRGPILNIGVPFGPRPIYRVKGRGGVFIATTDGKEIYIGSQRADEFVAAIEAAKVPT